MDRTVVESITGENSRIRDKGEEEAWNNYLYAICNAFERKTQTHFNGKKPLKVKRS